MVKVKTLFRKGYLLAGVVMAANMFVVNEVKAMEEKEITETNIKMAKQNLNPIAFNYFKLQKEFREQSLLGSLLYYENYINLIGGVVFSCANNYLKLWDYNPGIYWKLGCFGWRSGRLIKDIFQFEINLNIGRGISWLIPGIIGLMQYIKVEKYPILKSTAGLIMLKIVNIDNRASFGVSYFIIFLFQGFVSVPLAIHISNFSISISLDSILWAGVCKFLEPESNKDVKNKDINNLNNKIEEEMIEMNDINNEVGNNKK